MRPANPTPLPPGRKNEVDDFLSSVRAWAEGRVDIGVGVRAAARPRADQRDRPQVRTANYVAWWLLLDLGAHGELTII